MRIPCAESNEFPNDNPALHQGASWICLDPLAAPRLVARPAVIAKAAAAAVPAARASDGAPEVPVRSAVEVRSTLLPPAPSPAEAAAQAEADQFVAKFLARVSTLPPAPCVSDEAARAVRMAPIAQFMLDELPSYKLRRTAVSVPPPPAHAYVSSPALRLDSADVDSPLALVESLLPPPPPSLPVAVAEVTAPAQRVQPAEMAPAVSADVLEPVAVEEFAWRPEAVWTVVAVERRGYRVLGWQPVASKPLRTEPIGIVAQAVEEEVATIAPPVEATIEASVVEAVATEAASEDPVVEVVQIMEVAPTPEAPAVELASGVQAVAAETPAAVENAEGVAAEASGPPTAGEASDGYQAFVAALSDVLLQRGATRGAAVIGSILAGARIEADSLGETLVQQLTSAGLGELRGDQFLVAEAFGQAASSWKTVLSSESSDFSSCAETLDDWATRVVTALLPSPAATKDVRRELRRRGVAAFGMLAAA